MVSPCGSCEEIEFGSTFAPASVRAEDIDDWILPEHKIALALNLTQNIGVAQERNGFYRMNDISNNHTSVWTDYNNHWIVGCRATGVAMPGFKIDYRDDEIIGGLKDLPACDLGNVRIAREVVDQLLARELYFKENGPSEIYAQRALLIVGYSLGGAVALCLGEQISFAHIVSFSGGAPATRPRLTGPGPGRATHYTVNGDLVSSHVSPNAARVIRVDQGFNNDWGVIKPHL
jgi:hypothetical protein